MKVNAPESKIQFHRSVILKMLRPRESRKRALDMAGSMWAEFKPESPLEQLLLLHLIESEIRRTRFAAVHDPQYFREHAQSVRQFHATLKKLEKCRRDRELMKTKHETVGTTPVGRARDGRVVRPRDHEIEHCTSLGTHGQCDG